LQFAASRAIAFARLPGRSTEIMWWHAVGRARAQLEKLAAAFKASQSEYRIVAAYKGNYTETVTAAIFAFRSRSQPAYRQVSETDRDLIAAKGDLSGCSH